MDILKVIARPLVCLLICLTGTQCIQAQETLSVFKSSVNHAITHQKGIQNARLENEKVALDRKAVNGKLLPHLSMNAMYGYIHSNWDMDIPTRTLPITGIQLFDGTTQGNFSTQAAAAGVTATQVIFSGLQITYGQKALKEKYKAQAWLTEAGYDVIAQEIITSFDQIMLLKEVDVLIKDSEKRLSKEHAKVIKAIENGVAIPYDRDKIKLAMLELESKKAEVESNRDLLYYKLEELTGLSLEELQKISYVLEVLFLPEVNMEMNRKELLALESSQKAYEYVLKKEKGALLPQLFAFGNISYVNAFQTSATIHDVPYLGNVHLNSNHLQLAPNYLVGIGLKWDLFDGKAHKSAIEKAKLDIQIQENKLEETREKLNLLQQKCKADYELAMKKIAVSEQQKTIAKNNLFLASRQFEEGLSDVTERLEAENEYYKQSLNYYQQILGQRMAATELLKANGNLFQTIIR